MANLTGISGNQSATSGRDAWRLSRRDLLKGMGAGAAFLGGGSLLEACSGGLKGSGSGASGTIVIGYVSPQTGSLAEFATPDNFVLSKIRQSSAYSGGFKVGGKKYKVDIVTADSQSDPNRASQVARDLILNKHADMIVTSSAPETTNPVAVTCESQRVPCLSTVVPWESWYAGLGGNPVSPKTKYQYNAMFFFGLEEFGKCFVPMWKRVATNKVIAEMFPNDADGNAFRAGWPHIIPAAGYTSVDGGAYADGTTDYSSMISQFKAHDAQIYLNCPLPPDFNTFWKQASQQGFKPKLATVAKVLLFPADVTALGALVNNIATDSWWNPFAPYKSSLTGESAADLSTAYQQSTGQQWTQSIGSTYSLFEVAKEAFTAASDPHDRADVASKLHAVNYQGMSGMLNFANGPAPGVAIVPPVGVQWKPGKPGKFTNFPFAMYVVDNTQNPAIP
ncbi:MAG: ABC transporter substrate-binding protein, partial [Acidimicrobiaceae bacterium]|nr:ABC transporter substrate-binding protein [Acidimicrobiaceae bacterium]